MIIRKTTDDVGLNTNAMLGLSGLDTASMLKSMMKPYKVQISALSQKQQLVVWKQERYRELISKLNDLKSKYFDYRNPTTNIASPGTWKKFLIENPGSEYVKVTSTSSTRPKDGSIEYIKEPTASTITGHSGLAKEVVGTYAPDWAYAATYGRYLHINMDGIQRSITITASMVSADDPTRETMLQNAINAAFGIDSIDVEILGDGRLKLSAGINANQFIIMDGGARADLGFDVNANLSNKVMVTDTLYALDYRLKESMQFKSVMVYNNSGVLVPRNVVEFSINGVDFQFGSGDTLKDVMDAINNSICGVTMAYDNASDRFTLTASTCGPGDTIRLKEEETNFLSALGLGYTNDPIKITGGLVDPSFYDTVSLHNAANPLDPYIFDVTVNGVQKQITLSRNNYIDNEDLINDFGAKLKAAFPSSGITATLAPSGHIELTVDKSASNAAWSVTIEANAAHYNNPAIGDMAALGLDGLQAALTGPPGLPTQIRFLGGSLTPFPGIYNLLDGSVTPYTFDVTINGTTKQVILDRVFTGDNDLLAEVNSQLGALFPNAGVSMNAQQILGTWYIAMDINEKAAGAARSVSIGADMGDPAYAMLSTLGLDVLDTALQTFPTHTIVGGSVALPLYTTIIGQPEPYVFNININGVVRQIVLDRKDYMDDSDLLADVNAKLLAAYPNAGVTLGLVAPSEIALFVDTSATNAAWSIAFAPPTSPAVVDGAMNMMGLNALQASLDATLSKTEIKIIGGVIDAGLVGIINANNTPPPAANPYVFDVAVNGIERQVVIDGIYANEDDLIANVNAQLASAFPNAGFSIGVIQSTMNPLEWHLMFIIDKTASNAAWSISFDAANIPGNPALNPIVMDSFGLTGNLSSANLSASFTGYTAGEFGKVNIDGVILQVDRKEFEYDGVLYELKKLPPSGYGPIEFSIKADTDKIVELVKDFIEAYNEVVRSISAALGEKRDRDYMPLTDEQKEEMNEKEIEKWEAKVKSGLLRGDFNFISLSAKLRLLLYNPVYEKYGDNKTIPFSIKKMGIDTIDMSNGLGFYNPSDNGLLYVDEQALRYAIETNLDQVVQLFTRAPETFVPSAEDVDKPDSWKARMQRLYDDHTGGLVTKMLNVIDDYIRTMRGANNTKGALIERAGVENDSSDMDNAFSREIYNYNKQIDALWKRYDQIEKEKIKALSRLETIISNAGTQMQWLQGQLGQQ